MSYESENLKAFEDQTETDINELKGQIKQLETQINKIDIDYLKAVCYSLELLDPKRLYFDDDIIRLKQLIRILNVMDFNKSDYIISKLENEYKK